MTMIVAIAPAGRETDITFLDRIVTLYGICVVAVNIIILYSFAYSLSGGKLSETCARIVAAANG